jgi:diadenosine tetraphosphate (Ap4A) HIT family hydrolase
MFALHPRLQQDCFFINQWPLCHLLLMNDSQYPWCILVPARANITEIYQLSTADQTQLIHESSYLAQQLAILFDADKLNIAALGNMVPQLHIHHIVRYQQDPAWPQPVWGKLPAKAYPESVAQAVIHTLQQLQP